MNTKTPALIILTLIFALVLCGAASAGTPLAENQTGTVSGDLYVNTTDGWPSSTQGATNEVTQANTLPAYTSIDSAMVYVNVYSGSGTSNWPVRTTIKLDGNGDGDYDDAGELLGVEDMNIPGTTDGTVYWLNDHCNRVYSDYQVWYDVTGLITSNNPTLYVKTETLGGDGYDGRIKLLALTVAYNDGDTDQVHYWVLNGQDWINADTSPSTSTFNTYSFNGQVSSATLNTVALSGTDGTYTLNTSSLTGNLTETGSYYKEHQWDVTSNINTGADTNLTYTNTGSSLKMNLATLTIREATVYNGLADTAWPKYGQNNQNTGQSSYNGPQTNTVLWTYTTGGMINMSSPAIATDGTIYIGNNEGTLYAINPDGTLKWTYTTGRKISDSPAIASDGTIYIGNDEGTLYAINPDGTLKWTYTTGGKMGDSSAIAADGTIYFGSTDTKFYALNPDGTLKWTYTTGGQITGSPAIASDGTIYFGNYGDKKVYAINPDGTLKWTYTTGGTISHCAAVIGSDGTIYIGSMDKNLYALNPDGTLKWTYNMGGLYSSPSIGADGTIYIGGSKTMYALNPNGILIWSYTAPNSIAYSSPSIGADGTIYFLNGMVISALNPDGTLKWTYTNFGNTTRGSPAIGADGTLYIGSNDSKIYAFNQPVADFTADVTSGYTPLTVHFTNNSERATSWAWDFNNDGTVDSTEKNPTYNYNISDVYTVKLTAYSALSSNSMTKTDYITVNATTDTEAPTATATPTGGTYTDAVQVVLSATDNVDPNPLIYYTTNGEDPTTASTQYTSPITINENTTLKFLSMDLFGNIGALHTETYTINDTEVPIVTANPVSGTHNLNTTVTLSATDNVDPNPLIYYTTNGEDPTTASTLYTGPITLPNFAVTTLKLIAADKNGNISPVQTETYNITDTEAPTVTATQDVNKVILTATDNSDPNPAIYYTTDETDPTTSSTPYNGPFNIPGAAITVVKFIAVDVTGNTSPIQSQTFNTNRTTDILTGYYAEGNVGVKAVLYGGYGWFAYNAPGTGTAIFTPSSLNIPTGATILSARLYQSWTWRGYPEYTLQFNGTALTPTMHYVDGNDGQDLYDVTAYFNQNSDNTAVLTATGGCSYGTLLIVVYESGSEPYQKIWVNEGFDILYASTLYGSNPGPGHVYFNNVTTDNIASAQLTAILPSGQGDGDTIIFNGQNFTTTSRIDSTDPAYAYFNILPALQNGANEIEYPAGGYYSIQNAILTLTMQPADLTISNLQTNNPHVGTNTPVTATVTNNGGTNASNFLVKLYDNNIQVAKTTLASLAAGASLPVSFDWTPTTTGNHILAIITDAGYQITESDENNNLASAEVTVNPSAQPDLIATNLQLPVGPVIGTTNQVTTTITNQGAVDSSTFVVKLYDNNTQYATINLTGLAAGASTDVTFNWSTLTSGAHNLSIIADANQQITEYNEANNQISQQATVGESTLPDLALSNLQLPVSPTVAASYQVTATITNNGTVDASAFVVKLYDNNTQIAKINLTGLAAGTSTDVTFNWSTLTSGAHNLSVIADANQQITEYNENNNQISLALTVSPSTQPDLTVTDLQLPANPTAGTTYQITATITNLGTVDTGAFAVKLYDNNTQLGKINITSLSAGTSTQITFNWTPTTGTHNLAIKADANNQITEYNENNNQITQQITVS